MKGTGHKLGIEDKLIWKVIKGNLVIKVKKN